MIPNMRDFGVAHAEHFSGVPRDSDSSHLISSHAKRIMALAHKCNELVLRSKGRFHISVHHVLIHAVNARKNALILQPRLA